MRKTVTDPYTELAKTLDEMRETLGAMVASLMNDGFSEAQARTIVTGILGRVPGQDEGDS